MYDAPGTAGGAPPTGATTKLASNAGELLSESDDEMAGTGDKVAQCSKCSCPYSKTAWKLLNR